MSKVTLIDKGDGIFGWAVDGVVRICKYPLQPIVGNGQIITPVRECQSNCALCRLERKSEDRASIRISCGSGIEVYQAEETVTQKVKPITPGKIIN